MASRESGARPDAWANRWRTVDPGGPAVAVEATASLPHTPPTRSAPRAPSSPTPSQSVPWCRPPRRRLGAGVVLARTTPAATCVHGPPVDEIERTHCHVSRRRSSDENRRACGRCAQADAVGELRRLLRPLRHLGAVAGVVDLARGRPADGVDEAHALGRLVGGQLGPHVGLELGFGGGRPRVAVRPRR